MNINIQAFLCLIESTVIGLCELFLPIIIKCLGSFLCSSYIFFWNRHNVLKSNHKLHFML